MFNGISPMGTSGCFPRGKASCDRVALPNLRCTLGVFSVSVIHRTVTIMDYRIFNVLTDVNACDCTRGCTKAVRECTDRWLWEKNPLKHHGIETVSAACRSDALPAELHPRPISPAVIWRQAGKRTDRVRVHLGNPFSSKVVVYGHRPVTLSPVITEILTRLIPLPMLMKNHSGDDDVV